MRLAIAILNLSFSAKYFGVSIERDVWLLAFNAIIILDIAIWAPLNDTFRAKFLQVKQDQGEAAALDQTKSLLLVIGVITMLVVLLIELFPNIIGQAIAPDYNEKQQDALILMIRLLAPSFLINQFTKILISILNTYSSFIIPEIVGLFTQILTLLCIIILAPTIGISALAWSYYGGLIVLAVLLFYQIDKFKINLFRGFLYADVKKSFPFFLFSLPFFIPHFSSQINQVIEKSLASSFIGAVSILDYSRKFSDIPIDVLIGIFGSMMVPVLTLRFTQKDEKGFVEEFRKIFQFGFLVVTIVIATLTACPRAIVDFLYHKGNISEASLQEIALLTMYYSWAGFAIFLYHSFGLSLLSSSRGKLFAIYGTMAQLIMIGINIAFFKRLSVYTFPLSLGLSHFIAAGIMACYFPVRDKRLIVTTVKYTLMMLVITGLLLLTNLYLLPFENAVLIIVFNMFVLLFLLVSIVFVAKLEERDLFVSYIKKWTSRLS